MTRAFQYSAEQELWLHDLETTTEPQTKGYLHLIQAEGLREPGFCCLGRCCVVLGLPEDTSGPYGIFDGRHGVLPRTALTKLGLRETEGPHRDHKANSLVDLNDNGKSFAEIAAIIRSDPWGYFERDAIGTEDTASGENP